MRVIFMGTPDFALESLKALFTSEHQICGVYTQPDKPAKRGMKLQPSPVKVFAIEHSLPVFQPEKLGTESVLNEMKALNADIGVVVAYGKLIPKTILELATERGFINIHGSVLPKYRGSAPIQWTVINGEETAGVSSMFLNEGMDTGDIIDIAQTPVGENETYGELYDRLKVIGANLLVKTLKQIDSDSAKRVAQNESYASYAPPIRREDCYIDWTESAKSIVNKIRGLNPKPAAAGKLGNDVFKLYSALLTGRCSNAGPGKIVSESKEGIELTCGDGKTILITELQAPGGKRMKTADYLRGHKISL